MRSRVSALAALTLLCLSTPRACADTPLASQVVVSGLAKPAFVTAAPGDANRIFVCELDTGNAVIVKNGVLLPTPFLTTSNVNPGSERGFLGMAFHPQYPESGYVYVHHTQPFGISVIKRYTVSANPDSVDPSSVVTILEFPAPQHGHIGGWIGFGPDGYLYIGKGDATESANAQSDTSLFGKVLRIDVDGGFPYVIPPTNPFAAAAFPKNLFWVTGLRNPWRCSFDRATGDLYIADVGENSWEEIDFQAGASPGGENYGWAKFEGPDVFDCPDPCDSSGLTPPALAISHPPIIPNFCAITGGYVYRGAAIPDCDGRYFYGDYCTGRIYSTRVVGGVATDVKDHTAELDSGGQITLLISFGEDANGEMYFTDFVGGEVFKIVPDAVGIDAPASRPASVALSRPWPNPSAAGFAFRVSAPGERRAHMRVYDPSGRLVRTLFDGALRSGARSFEWDATDERGRAVPGGVYLIRLDAGGESITRKASVVR